MPIYDIRFRVTIDAADETEALEHAERLEDNLRDPMLSVQAVNTFPLVLTGPGAAVLVSGCPVKTENVGSSPAPRATILL